MKVTSKQLQKAIENLPDPYLCRKSGRYEYRVAILHPLIITDKTAPEHIHTCEIVFKLSDEYGHLQWVLEI